MGFIERIFGLEVTDIAKAEAPTPPPLFHGVIASSQQQQLIGRGSLLDAPNAPGPKFDAKLQWAAYNKSRYLATVVDLIANACSKKWHLERKDGSENVPEEAALIESFLNSPNPDDTFESLTQQIIRDWCLHGGTFLEFHASPVNTQALSDVMKALDWLPDAQAEAIDAIGAVPEPGFPTYLGHLDFEQMECLTDSKGHITGYKQHCIDGGTIDFDVSEILHIRHPKSKSKVYGDSPLNPILQTVALENLIAQRHYHVLQNDIIADSLFILKEGRTQDEARAFFEEVQSKYTSRGSAGNFLVTASDVEFQNIAQGGKDGEFMKLSEQLRNIIAMRYGVSPSVLGDTAGTGGTSGSNYSAGTDTTYRIFIENAVRPLAKHLEAMFNRKLLSHFGAIGLEYVIVYDLFDSDDMADVEATWDMMLRNGSTTINEVRQARGRQQNVPGGDVPMIYTATGATPVEIASEGPPDPPPMVMAPAHPNGPPEASAAPVSPGKEQVDKAVSDLQSALRVLRKAF